MKTNVANEVARLKKMSVNQLAKRFEEVFGEECRSRHKRYLVRRIAWRLQANAEGEPTSTGGSAATIRPGRSSTIRTSSAGRLSTAA